MSRISNLPPPAPLTGLELSPLVQGGGADSGVGVPILAYATQPGGAVAALRRPMVADHASTTIGAPPAGGIRWDAADPGDATHLVISTTDAEAQSLATALANVVPGGFVYVQGASLPDAENSAARQNLQKWQVASVANGTGYVSVAGTIVASSGDMAVAELLELTIQGATPSPGYDRAVVTAVSSVSGVTQLDASLGDYFVTALTENTAIQILNPLAAGSLMVRITQGNPARTVAWPSSFRWAGGVPGVVSTGNGAVDLLALTTFNAGATWMATLAKGFAA